MTSITSIFQVQADPGYKLILVCHNQMVAPVHLLEGGLEMK